MQITIVGGVTVTSIEFEYDGRNRVAVLEYAQGSWVLNEAGARKHIARNRMKYADALKLAICEMAKRVGYNEL